MSKTFEVTINHAAQEKLFENGKWVPTGRWLLGITGGGEDCLEEQSAYVPVEAKIGARISRLLGETEDGKMAADLIVHGDFDFDDQNLAYCFWCKSEMSSEGTCPACGWDPEFEEVEHD